MTAANHAIVYCENAFNTPNGKTAHGLVRFSKRYNIFSVIDSRHAGNDAGEVLDGVHKNVPVLASLRQALHQAGKHNLTPNHFIIGLAPDGGRMSPGVKEVIKEAIKANLNIVCGLHDFLTDDNQIVKLADRYNIRLKDVRKPPERQDLHFFSAKIEEVKALKVAILGTDSAIGKRTTAWILVNSLLASGIKTELIGTAQTAWMQGADYGIILDSLINDFVTGEIEHAVWQAWKETDPDVIVIEGQGSLLNPAYPGGYEILAAARPDLVVLQHAPARKEYDGFPGYKIQPLKKQIMAIEIISDKPVIAVTINHENLSNSDIINEIKKINSTIKLPAFDLLRHGGNELSQLVTAKMKNTSRKLKHRLPK